MSEPGPFTIGENTIEPGTRAHVELPVSRLFTGAEVSMPVTVLHGKEPGVTMWINAAIHGDEINGVEIVNRVMSDLDPETMRGTILAVPVVNVHGFITGDRYLPDRRDLNRSFPGSRKGSLASRLANLFMTEIVSHCSIGIDLHTASDNRTNLPQIRGNLDDETTRTLAEVFGPPFIMHSKNRSGTLRQAAVKAGASVLLYEAGEPLRFNRLSIDTGVAGIRRVLRHLDIADWDGPDGEPAAVSRGSSWVRASKSGLARFDVEIGETVVEREEMGAIIDVFGKRLATIRASRSGLVIGRTLYPLVNKGDALVHVASLDEAE